MAPTLSDGTTTLTLPDDMRWSDELTWTPVEQTVTTSITGAAIVAVAVRRNGRPITLVSEIGYGWMTHAVALQLRSWAAEAGRTLILTLRSTAYEVIFRHQDPPALELVAVVDYTAPAAADYFFGTLKFTEI